MFSVMAGTTVVFCLASTLLAQDEPGAAAQPGNADPKPGEAVAENVEIKCRILEVKTEECPACRESRKKNGRPVMHVRPCAETWTKVEVLQVTRGNLGATQAWLLLSGGPLPEAKPGVEGLATLEPYPHRKTQKPPEKDRFICTKWVVVDPGKPDAKGKE